MNLETARIAIERAPLTHLGAAAKFVLQLLDEADTKRLDEQKGQLAVQAAEIARLTLELQPLTKLRALEHAVREVVGGIPPTGVYPRAVFERIKSLLTPHLP